MRAVAQGVAALALAVLAACSGQKPRDAEKPGVADAADRSAELIGHDGLHGKLIGVADPSVADTVYFDYDKATLRPEAQKALAGVARFMQHHHDLQVMIAGHADERGTREYNLALGNLRAVAVRNYLIALGVPAMRLDTISYGKERPAVVGSDEAAWSQNRRAVAGIE
ncbi:MAG TPA: peptidoglycan-associated lipoprotein Pal [Stellaceae bacterium]|nr:peptidoglycan-associated lipoprotein Pal [Stellaceae bacterium]